jgi:hypothetical protein
LRGCQANTDWTVQTFPLTCLCICRIETSRRCQLGRDSHGAVCILLFISSFFPDVERLGVTRLQPQVNGTTVVTVVVAVLLTSQPDVPESQTRRKEKQMAKRLNSWPIKELLRVNQTAAYEGLLPVLLLILLLLLLSTSTYCYCSIAILLLTKNPRKLARCRVSTSR